MNFNSLYDEYNSIVYYKKLDDWLKLKRDNEWEIPKICRGENYSENYVDGLVETMDLRRRLSAALHLHTETE